MIRKTKKCTLRILRFKKKFEDRIKAKRPEANTKNILDLEYVNMRAMKLIAQNILLIKIQFT